MCSPQIIASHQDLYSIVFIEAQDRPDPRTVFSTENHSLHIGIAEHASTEKSCQLKSSDAHCNTLHTQYCNANISKTKSYLVLTLILCAILARTAHAKPATIAGQRLILHTPEHRQLYHQQLLQQRRTQAPPTTHHRHHLHHRSADNMSQAPLNADCVYNGIFEQAKSTILNLGSELKRYSENRYQQSMENLNNTWKNFRFQQLKHPFAKEMSSPEHRLAMERELKDANSEIVFKKMMERAFVTIKMLNDTYEEVKSYFENNAERIKHDIGNENYLKVQPFLEQCHSYLKYDLDELKRVLIALNIAEPSSDSIQTSNFHLEPRLEWQLVRDHLLIMNFLGPMYEILIESCQAKMH